MNLTHISRESKHGRSALFVRLILMMIMFLLVNPFAIQTLLAQETQKPAETKTPVHLSEQQWKAVEGIYQDPGNPDRYVQFTPRENVLVAKLLWNNAEIQLIPESEFAFVSKEAVEDGLLHIVFNKDSSGAVNVVKVENLGSWKRAKNYKPVVKYEMEHTPEQLKVFEGLYQLQNEPDRFIQFTVKENNLVLKQHWDGNQIYFVPETPLDFFSKDQPLFTMQFTKDSYGSVTQVVAFRRDVWIKTRKANLTADQLKAVEGKYQFKDDPDNFILITAKNNKLVVKQLWDGKEISLDPQTDSYFYNEAESYPLQVVRDKVGTVIQVVVLGVDQFNKTK